MEQLELSKIEGIIEAILFTMGESVELKKIAAAIEHDDVNLGRILNSPFSHFTKYDNIIK